MHWKPCTEVIFRTRFAKILTDHIWTHVWMTVRSFECTLRGNCKYPDSGSVLVWDTYLLYANNAHPDLWTAGCCWISGLSGFTFLSSMEWAYGLPPMFCSAWMILQQLQLCYHHSPLRNPNCCESCRRDAHCFLDEQQKKSLRFSLIPEKEHPFNSCCSRLGFVNGAVWSWHAVTVPA